jgi:hypothetical protein
LISVPKIFCISFVLLCLEWSEKCHCCGSGLFSRYRIPASIFFHPVDPNFFIPESASKISSNLTQKWFQKSLKCAPDPGGGGGGEPIIRVGIGGRRGFDHTGAEHFTVIPCYKICTIKGSWYLGKGGGAACTRTRATYEISH